MSLSMRKHCTSLIGKTVIVHHVDGTAYHGVLHSVNNQGIYLMNARVANLMSAMSTQIESNHALSHEVSVDATEAFFPFFFLPFVALAGVAAASAYAPYGYYPYGGYGYPGYYW